MTLTRMLPYEFKDRSDIRIMQELGAKKIVFRVGCFVAYTIKKTPDKNSA